MLKPDVFRVPVYTFHFEDHHRYADDWKLYNDVYRHYTESEGNRVKLSLPNFHKNGTWAPLTMFFERCLEEVKGDLDFDFEIGITAMWSTIQGRGGHHHMHSHKNCMFVGTYYLYSDIEDPNGTTFHNVMSDFSSFKIHGFYGGKSDKTRRVRESTSWFDGGHHVPFEAGKLVIYPGWMRHSGTPHAGENRQIVAFNAMPIGKLDKDPLQRYSYADFRDTKHPYDDM